MTSKAEMFPALEGPPIQEVVCGIVFESMPDLDALVLGIYWDRVRSRFPKHSLQPALADESQIGFEFGAMLSTRAFLSSADDQYFLQLQHDRFFLNWRATGSVYPRFSERRGSGGLLKRAMEEFGEFSAFVEKQTSHALQPKRVELAKVDLFQRGKHWQSAAELAVMLPVTAAFGSANTSGPEINLRAVDRAEATMTIVSVVTAMRENQTVAVKLETRCVSPIQGGLLETFESANARLNKIFFAMVPDAQARFGKKREEQ